VIVQSNGKEKWSPSLSLLQCAVRRASVSTPERRGLQRPRMPGLGNDAGGGGGAPVILLIRDDRLDSHEYEFGYLE